MALKEARLLGSLLGLSVLACSGDSNLKGIDLAALAATAEPWTETATIDLREPASRPALISGWSAPAGESADFLLGDAGGSQLAFRRVDAARFRLRLDGWSEAGGAAGTLVAVAVNGTGVGQVRLGAEPGPVEIAVPAGVARPGRNQLELTSSEAGGPESSRGLVAWRSFGFGVRPAPLAPAVVGATSRRLELWAGTGLDYFVTLAGGARLQLAGIASRGGARLEADLACEGEAPRFDLLAETGRGDVEVALRRTLADAAPCRLTLRVAGGEGRSGDALVRVGQARLLQAPPEQIETSAYAAAESRPNFLVYIVDTLRADRLGCYGYGRPLTPAIDAFARQGILFEQARAQSSWTRPTVATMLTGMTPIRLGVNDRLSRLPEEVETLSERLRAQGYRTAYVTANGNTAAVFGFNQGLDLFKQVGRNKRSGEPPGWRDVHAAGRKFLDQIEGDAPFLLVLHTVEPHAPYEADPRHLERWAPGADRKLGVRRVLDGLPRRRPDPEGETVRQVRALYDAEVAGTDEGFGELLAELEQRRRLEDTVILFTADHGEELFEHGQVEHGRTLYEEQLRIPMIWRWPGGRHGGRRVASRVDQLDVTPTILELAGLPVPRELPGRSLAANLAGGPPPAERPSPAWLKRLRWHQESLVDGRFKLIRNLNPRLPGTIEERLYDLERDAAERGPIGEGRDERRGLLRAQVRFWAQRSGPALEGGDAELDEKLRDELAALGYLN